jgi:5-methylcytosine-specific restriction endonuclease McrA
MKVCRLCGRGKPAEQFLAGKAKRVSSSCSTCRRKAQAKHVKNYYRSLPPDERHRLTHKRRAEEYGVVHEAYSRAEVFKRWDYRCAYCNGPASHMDHVQPLSKGGGDVEANVVPACVSCNLSKGAKTLAEWAESFAPEPPPF